MTAATSGDAGATVVAIGECMIELTHRTLDDLRLGFAGDTYNTAVYLRRELNARARVHYLTALGDDWYSERLLAAMAAEGITAHVHREPGGTPGLYLVRTAPDGERNFTYHRDGSPATRLFDEALDDAATELILGADLVYLSAISLQIITDRARARLADLLDRARRRHVRVAFDSNYRPRGWPSQRHAATAIDDTARFVDVALPTLEDEQALRPGTTAQEVIEHYHRLGAAEVIVKRGTEPTLVSADGTVHEVPLLSFVAPVDTTGAGDSFNAGYLAARMAGTDAVSAVHAGQRLAARVVMYPGAILPAVPLPIPDPATAQAPTTPTGKARP